MTKGKFAIIGIMVLGILGAAVRPPHAALRESSRP